MRAAVASLLAVKPSQAAVAAILAQTNETMHGIVAVDFREAKDKMPLITEINLRHVAATYAFAAAGFNLAEAQLLLTLGRVDELGPKEAIYPDHNMILRDIDGAPIWLADYRVLTVGDSVPRPDDQNTM